MTVKKRLINRSNFLLVQEYLTYLLQTKNKNPKSVDRYRFWLYHLLRWAMETPLEKAHKIETPFLAYTKDLGMAQESQKKTVETALALWRDQAMACMLFLSGARASAAATLPIKAVHLNDEHPCIEQKPELGVRTKNGKAATTYLHVIPSRLAVHWTIPTHAQVLSTVPQSLHHILQRLLFETHWGGASAV